MTGRCGVVAENSLWLILGSYTRAGLHPGQVCYSHCIQAFFLCTANSVIRLFLIDNLRFIVLLIGFIKVIDNAR